ncbi:sorting nexin-27 isoform X2 [Bombyx mori]|uniref:sorting nexin-27 isoform X2 n=1 Tax=Bombyx mori TaxID=7091 RepID=UPI002ED11387
MAVHRGGNGNFRYSYYYCENTGFEIYDLEDEGKMTNRNGVNVEGSTHRQVVDLIKSGGDCLTLTVISVTQREAERLEPCDDSSAPVGVIGGAANSRATVYQRYDYTDKRSLPVSIPDYRIVMERNTGRSYIAFNIHMAGRHLCSRRYREFAALHQVLRKEFIGFNFPKLPGKWPFTLSEQQLDSRRRGLEQYLEKVCAVRVIAECESVQEFLTDCDDSSNPAPVELKVLLPDRDVATVSVLRSTRADLVYRAVADKIRLADTVQQYFYLFEIVEYNFERKLQPNECPHSLYIQNYSTASSSCLCIRKWLFNPRVEVALVAEDPLAANFIFWQAVEDVNRGTCAAGARLYQLKAMQEPRRAHDYLALARTLPGYGHVAIPHPTLRLALGWSGIKLSPHEEEAPGEECAEVPWSCVLGWARDDDATAVRLTYARPDRPPRTLLLCTPYVSTAPRPAPPRPAPPRHATLTRPVAVPVPVPGQLHGQNSGGGELGRHRRVTHPRAHNTHFTQRMECWEIIIDYLNCLSG